MQLLETAAPTDLNEDSAWSAPPPVKIDEEQLDILAFELWQRASRQDLAAEEDCPDEDITVGCHASCL